MVPSSSSSTDGPFSMNTLLHMMSIKFSSGNYLLWRNQMLHVFTYQNLLGHIDGTSPSLSPTIIEENKIRPNPVGATWKETDYRAIIPLHSSLTEEAATEVLGL